MNGSFEPIIDSIGSQLSHRNPHLAAHLSRDPIQVDSLNYANTVLNS